MPYAINAQNNGCRAINSEDDILPGETYSEEQPIIQKTKTQKLSERTEQYASDISVLQQQWLSAAVEDGVNESDRKSDIEAEIADTKTQYLADLAVIRSS